MSFDPVTFALCKPKEDGSPGGISGAFQLEWLMFAEKVPIDGTPVRINDSMGGQLSNIAGNGFPFAATVDIDVGEEYGLRISGVFVVGGETLPSPAGGVSFNFSAATITMNELQVMIEHDEDGWLMYLIVPPEE